MFIGEGEKTRNKVLKNHITVSVVINLGVGKQKIRDKKLERQKQIENNCGRRFNFVVNLKDRFNKLIKLI